MDNSGKGEEEIKRTEDTPSLGAEVSREAGESEEAGRLVDEEEKEGNVKELEEEKEGKKEEKNVEEGGEKEVKNVEKEEETEENVVEEEKERKNLEKEEEKEGNNVEKEERNVEKEEENERNNLGNEEEDNERKGVEKEEKKAEKEEENEGKDVEKEEETQGKDLEKEEEKKGKDLEKEEETEGQDLEKEEENKGKDVEKEEETQGKDLEKEEEKKGKDVEKEEAKKGKDLEKEEETGGKDLEKEEENKGKDVEKEEENKGKDVEKEEENQGKDVEKEEENKGKDVEKEEEREEKNAPKDESQETEEKAEKIEMTKETDSTPLPPENVAMAEQVEVKGETLSTGELPILTNDESEESGRIEPRIPVPPELKQNEDQSDKGENEATKLMPNSALNIGWSFGFNHNIPVWNLTDCTQSLIIYTSSHAGVIYDYVNNTQSILQGHANSINCTTISADKKWLVTADKGKDSTVIVWDTRTSFPVRTFFNASENGMEAICLTPDARYLATMSAAEAQDSLKLHLGNDQFYDVCVELGNYRVVKKSGNMLKQFSIWDWTVSEDKPITSVTLPPQFSGQNYIFFCEEYENYIVSNSESRVIFYHWKEDTINYFAPPLTDKDFHTQIGKYSQSIIISDPRHALTATLVGNLVVWDTSITSLGKGRRNMIANKKAAKIIPLVTCGITVLTLHNLNIVIGDMTGNVSFFDQRMTLLHCFNNLHLGPVKSISFSLPPKTKQSQPLQSMSSSIDRLGFPDFIISSSTAKCALVHIQKPEIKIILSEHEKPVHAIAVHPFMPFFATGSDAGILKLYDYENKVAVASQTFDKEIISCCTFSPDGCHLALGFLSGFIKVLDTFTLKAEKHDIHCYSKEAIIRIVISENSDYLATADTHFTTTVLKKEKSTFVYLGRYQAHYKPIHDLMFGKKFGSEEPRLLSLGQDRMLVEYDLAASSVDNLCILSSERIEQSAVPMCMAWHPPLNKEHFIVTANDEFKYKLYNTTTMKCRKTTLAPIHEFPIEKLIVLPTKGVDPTHMYMAFFTNDKVGLQILPFDGNPHQATALIAQPLGVHTMVASYDGKFLFTTSRHESSVHMWHINASYLEAQLRLGGEDLIPFYQLLEGGREGAFMEELKEYFYYCQLQSSDINLTSAEIISKTIPVTEIPNMMRALGFYPSEQELTDMVNEVKYSEYVDRGEFKEKINLAEFLKLYINHRPYRSMMVEKLQWAFNVLGEGKDDLEVDSLRTDDLMNLIRAKGEHITNEELNDILMDICYIDEEKDDVQLPEVLTASSFAYNFLGFPEDP